MKDSWGIREYDDKKLVAVLRDHFACEEAVMVAMAEALARLLERKG